VIPSGQSNDKTGEMARKTADMSMPVFPALRSSGAFFSGGIRVTLPPFQRLRQCLEQAGYTVND